MTIDDTVMNHRGNGLSNHPGNMCILITLLTVYVNHHGYEGELISMHGDVVCTFHYGNDIKVSVM